MIINVKIRDLYKIIFHAYNPQFYAYNPQFYAYNQQYGGTKHYNKKKPPDSLIEIKKKQRINYQKMMERAKKDAPLRKIRYIKRIYNFFKESFKVDKEEITLTKNEQFLITNIYDTFFKNSNIPIEEIEEMIYMFYCMCIYYLHIDRNKYLHLDMYLNPSKDIYVNVDDFGPDNYESYFADLRLKDAIQKVQFVAQKRLEEEEQYFQQQQQQFQPFQPFQQQQFQQFQQFQQPSIVFGGGKSKKRKLKNKRKQTKHNKKRINTRKIKIKRRKTRKRY